MTKKLDRNAYLQLLTDTIASLDKFRPDDLGSAIMVVPGISPGHKQGVETTFCISIYTNAFTAQMLTHTAACLRANATETVNTAQEPS